MMTGVADAAALHRALLPEDAPPETRAVIDAIELCLADLAHTAGPATDSGGDPSDYAASMVSSARARLSAVGVEPDAEGLATERFAEMAPSIVLHYPQRLYAHPRALRGLSDGILFDHSDRFRSVYLWHEDGE